MQSSVTVIDIRCSSAAGSANAQTSAGRPVATSCHERVRDGPALAKPEADGRDLPSCQEK